MIKVTGSNTSRRQIKCKDLTLGQFFAFEGKLYLFSRESTTWMFISPISDGEIIEIDDNEETDNVPCGVEDMVDLVDVNITWSYK